MLNGIWDYCKKKMNDQDFMQKVNVGVSVSLELYRVMVGSFLILFVPQKCGENVCSLSENLESENILYTAGLVSNFVTMGTMAVMYGFEIYRENKLITYLEVNPNKPSDNNSVSNVINNNLSEKRKKLILSLDKNYQRASYSSMLMFVTNTVLSGFVINKYYLDNQTTTTFITNTLFLVSKLADVYTTVNTDEYIFYSAYLKGKIQYNDIDLTPPSSPSSQISIIIEPEPETETETGKVAEQEMVIVEMKEEVV